MPASIPYIFCRYQISLGDEVLGHSAQSVFFSEGQGQSMAYRRRGEESATSSALFCEVDIARDSSHDSIAFMIGLQPGVRTVVGYDSETKKRTRNLQPDTHIKFAHLVVLPHYGFMAIQDRANDFNIPARTALGVLRSIIRGHDGDLAIIHLTDGEVRRAVHTWDLKSYHYSVRPLNPISLSDLTNERSDRMKAENVGREVGTLTALDGASMHPAHGTIAQTQEMVDAGYGQNGFKGYTPDGQLAHVPKPTFHMDKKKNLAERDKPRFMRIMFDVDEGSDAPDSAVIAAALMRFYAPDETTPPL